MESHPRQCRAGDVTFTETLPAEGNIRLTSPRADETVGLPFVAEGTARVFENNVNWRLRDADGTVLAEGFATATGDVGEFGPFSVRVSYPQPRGTSGTFEVFATSAEDGTEQDRVSVPVRFAPTQSQDVRVFFGSTAQDPGALRCDVAYPVTRRIARTDAPARAAIEELLAGPTARESREGYTTSIPAGVTVRALTIRDGLARIDFSEELRAAAGGSCRVNAVRAQIERTLLQFPTVSRVEILVGGQPDVLEP